MPSKNKILEIEGAESMYTGKCGGEKCEFFTKTKEKEKKIFHHECGEISQFQSCVVHYI